VSNIACFFFIQWPGSVAMCCEGENADLIFSGGKQSLNSNLSLWVQPSPNAQKMTPHKIRVKNTGLLPSHNRRCFTAKQGDLFLRPAAMFHFFAPVASLARGGLVLHECLRTTSPVWFMSALRPDEMLNVHPDSVSAFIKTSIAGEGRLACACVWNQCLQCAVKM